MNKNAERLFESLRIKEPPKDLYNRIISQIRIKESYVKIKNQFIVFSIITLIAISIFLSAFDIFQKNVSSTGFYDFASLIMSDLKSILINWQDFIMAICESLPVASFTALLIMSIILIATFAKLFQTAKSFFNQYHLINKPHGCK